MRVYFDIQSPTMAERDADLARRLPEGFSRLLPKTECPVRKVIDYENMPKLVLDYSPLDGVDLAYPSSIPTKTQHLKQEVLKVRRYRERYRETYIGSRTWWKRWINHLSGEPYLFLDKLVTVWTEPDEVIKHDLYYRATWVDE